MFVLLRRGKNHLLVGSFAGGAGQILAREGNVAEDDFLAPDAVNAGMVLNRLGIGREEDFRFLNLRVQRANVGGKYVAGFLNDPSGLFSAHTSCHR